jgi:hypothetical protein
MINKSFIYSRIKGIEPLAQYDAIGMIRIALTSSYNY